MYRKWEHAGPLYRATYYSWHSMVSRCTKKHDSNFPAYGGRGITVCRRWRRSFDAFVRDMGVRPAGMTVDRINNEGHYEPGNCRWATKIEQGRNRRTNCLITFREQTRTLIEWAEALGTNKITLGSYARRHSPEKAIERFLARMEF